MDGPLRAGHEQHPSALSLQHVVAFLHTEGACRVLSRHARICLARCCAPWPAALCCVDSASGWDHADALVWPQAFMRLRRPCCGRSRSGALIDTPRRRRMASAPRPPWHRRRTAIAQRSPPPHTDRRSARGAAARRGGAAGKGGAAADPRSAIRLADPVRCDRAQPRCGD